MKEESCLTSHRGCDRAGHLNALHYRSDNNRFTKVLSPSAKYVSECLKVDVVNSLVQGLNDEY